MRRAGTKVAYIPCTADEWDQAKIAAIKRKMSLADFIAFAVKEKSKEN